MANLTILICDDEAHIRRMVAARLREDNYTVIEARDGEQALHLATQTPPDLIVSDLQMPFMSGLELATALRAQASTTHVPVVMLTARGHVLSEEDLKKTNVIRLLAKPFSARELGTHVREIAGPSDPLAAAA
ncbi:MAG: response regulator [Planctomycetota bacterium]|nr:response regulator [Planctomycetota bacterium]